MNLLAVVFDIDELGGGFYGLSAYQRLFNAIGRNLLKGCSISDGDTQANLNGETRDYCIAVKVPDLSQFDAIRADLVRAKENGELGARAKIVSDEAVVDEPLVSAGHIDSSGTLLGCDTDWISAAWDQAKA